MTKNTDLEAVKAKIASILAKTESNGASESEAEAAMYLARSLMKKHSLKMEDIANRSVHLHDFVERRVTTGFRHPIDRLCVRPIGLYTDTKGYWLNAIDPKTKKRLKGRGGVHFFGYKVDVELAEYIYRVCRSEADALWDKYKVQLPVGARATVRVAYMLGIADKLADRLLALLEEDVKATGTELIVLKNALVEAAFNESGPTAVTNNRNIVVKDYQEEAFFAGYDDGDKIHFNRELNKNGEKIAIGG